jgi:predicted amidohydrolase YtcJ
MYNNDNPSAEDKAHFFEVALWAAKQGLTLTEHWQNGNSAHHLLEDPGKVHQETPLTPLEVVHCTLERCELQNLPKNAKTWRRLAMQDAMYLDGEQLLNIVALRRSSKCPCWSVLKQPKSISVQAQMRTVANYNPFVALQWMLDGRSASGIALDVEEEIPTREQALYMYTSGSAWLAHAERQTRQPSTWGAC